MTNNTNFLPKDYSVPESIGNYMKLKDGQNRFRVLSSAIVGWIDWQDINGQRKPIRYKSDEKPDKSFDPAKPLKAFWSFVVWNYADKAIQILEITQKTIMGQIKAYVDNEAWGNPKTYDLVITRTGEGMDTEYNTVANPHTNLSTDIASIYENTPIDLNLLYTNGDPFKPLTSDGRPVPSF